MHAEGTIGKERAELKEQNHYLGAFLFTNRTMREETGKTKPKRKGVFIGGYVHPDARDFLKERACREHRSLSNMLNIILLRAAGKLPEEK